MPGKDKFIYKGPSVQELYFRQNSNCWLELETDEIRGKELFGEVYCTDGEHRFPTMSLLNPSSKCMKCLVDFIESVYNGELKENAKKE